jgi:uncharacterized repeat protein (TIGR03803 family)
MAVALPAQTFTTLHSFDYMDGYAPEAALVQGTNGNFYGTTFFGGANYAGTVFKITPSGTLTTLHSFCAQRHCPDGELPTAALVQATNGDFYGTTHRGGANGAGTVFKITPSGMLTTLYKFCSQSNCTDGLAPHGVLIQVTDGTLYGTTVYGGTSTYCGNSGCGTVFKITPNGALTTLHSFDGADGASPAAGLVQATDGNLYGVTSVDGAKGDGTVFKITRGGTLTTLHSFDGRDGATPQAALVQATNGDFYGTTYYGGATGNGTVFKITASGNLTTLHTFDNTDGRAPTAALVRGTDGNFYGTTAGGGAYGHGTIFKVTPSGTLTTLHSFDGPDGFEPYGGLVQDTNGTFYGTAAYSGTSGAGTIFSLSVGLGPFVATRPTSGEVGKAVKILGTDLTGATSVTFNGTAATFTVKSKSEITTTVPTGATTGKVSVVTPHGTLSSNVPFRVK